MESRSLLLPLGVLIMLLVQVWAVETLDLYAVPRTKPTGLVRPWEEVTVWIQVANGSEPYFNVTVEVGGYNGLNGITYDVFSVTFEEDSIWVCEIVPYPNRTAGFGRCTSTKPTISFDELTFRAIVASDMESVRIPPELLSSVGAEQYHYIHIKLKPSQSVFDQGLVQIYGWTEEDEFKQQQLAGFWVSVGAPSTDFKGLITEMDPDPLEGYVPGVSSHSFLPLFENLGPSRVLKATCSIILSPSWATKWDAACLVANPYCKISNRNESIVECISADQHEPVPKNMVLNFWSANETLVPPKLGFVVTSPLIREPITVTTSCTTPYVYSNDPTPTVIPLGDIDAQVAAFFQAPVNASATVNEAMHWSVDLTNFGRSSSLNSRCTWNFSLPLEEHAFFASTNRSDCLPSFSQVDEMLMIQCVGDVHPQQLLRLDFQLTFAHSLPAAFNLHYSVACLDELEKVVLVDHASFVVVGGASGDSDADLSSKEVGMALSLGLGLGVPVMCLLLAGGYWLWRQPRTRTRKKTLSAVQTTQLKDGLRGIMNRNICSINSNSTQDLELGFSWEIPFEELEFNDEIGRGAFGVVWRGVWRESDVAIKKLQESNWDEFAVELDIMQKLRPHANVLQLLGVAYQDNVPFCVTELMPKGNLWHFLQTDEGKEYIQTTTNLIQMAKEIAAGMHHLHSEGIVHRDLAARNLLLTESNEIKVSDFGLSRLVVKLESKQEVVGPLKWMAPECFIESKYSEKSDVWSYGITLWEIVTFGKEPYSQLNGIQVASMLINAINKETPITSLTIPITTSKIIIQLINQCLNLTPDQRPSFKEILSILKT